jgi:hypothetical protein
VRFFAEPNPAVVGERGLGKTTLHWAAPDVEEVQVRIDSPVGPLLAIGEQEGETTTGPWVRPGTVFYLLDATNTRVMSPDHVLATVQVAVEAEAANAF